MPEPATTSHPVWFNGIRLTPEPDARQNFIVCDDPITPNMKDGWHQENTKFLRLALGHAVTLPQYSFAAHQKKADKTLPKPDEESWRGGKIIEISDKNPTFIIDADGIVGGLVIPMYFKGNSLTHMSLYATTLAQLELAKAMEKVRKNLDPRTSVSWHEHREDRYLVMDGIFGELHFCKAWHARGHQHSDHFAPSRELIGSKSNIELANRFLYIDALQAAAFRTNDLVAQAFPALSTLLRSASKPLQEDPIIRAVDNIWHSDFFGQALLMNKQSGEHLDVNGVRRAWDILYASGDFHGGELFLKDMNVRIPFKPGTLVAFDGTAQRHAIQPFEGPQRISSVFFVHQSVFHELGIDSTLPDLTTTMVMNSLARQKKRYIDATGSEEPVEKKQKKRPGKGKGRRFATDTTS